MIKSMTGFGRAECATQNGKVTVEVRSLNGKTLDFSLRCPSLFRSAESQIRQKATAMLVRGKTDMSISYQNDNSSTSATINKTVFRNYYNQLSNIAREVGFELDSEPMLSTIMRMPEVLSTESNELNDEDTTAILSAVEEACLHLNSFRKQEGKVLINDILGRTSTIAELLKSVEQFEGERIEIVKARLADNLAKAAVNVDANRFEAEIIYYLEKFDVTEEKVRLAQHIAYFAEVANSDADSGRKLGFIAQEMGREINTLGSKANHSSMQRIVVEMKDELEKIKEQLLNIL